MTERCRHIINNRSERCRLACLDSYSNLCFLHDSWFDTDPLSDCLILSDIQIDYIYSHPELREEVISSIIKETLESTARFFHLNPRGTKSQILERILENFRMRPEVLIPSSEDRLSQLTDTISPASKMRSEEDMSIIIQKIWRGHRTRIQGPAMRLNKLCVNETDFMTLETLSETDSKLIFSYRQNDHIYWFNLTSIYGLIRSIKDSSPVLNPYNRKEIPKSVIDRALAYYRIIEDYIKEKEAAETPPVTPETAIQQNIQRFNTIVFDLFRKIDSLGYITDSNWFLSLNLRQLNLFVYELFEIWMYRSGLTDPQRIRISGSRNGIFSGDLSTTCISEASRDYWEMRYIGAALINKFINTGVIAEFRSTGAIFVLSALSSVCPEVREAIPWISEI